MGTELDQQEKAALLNALHGNAAAAENELNLAQPSTVKHQNNNDILSTSRDKTFL